MDLKVRLSDDLDNILKNYPSGKEGNLVFDLENGYMLCGKVHHYYKETTTEFYELKSYDETLTIKLNEPIVNDVDCRNSFSSYRVSYIFSDLCMQLMDIISPIKLRDIILK